MRNLFNIQLFYRLVGLLRAAALYQWGIRSALKLDHEFWEVVCAACGRDDRYSDGHQAQALRIAGCMPDANSLWLSYSRAVAGTRASTLTDRVSNGVVLAAGRPAGQI